MANFLIYKFSQKARFRLAIIFTIICVEQLCLGVLITAWSIYIILSISKHLYSEKSEITFVFTVTGMYGTHIILQYLIGFKICEKCYTRAHKRSTRRQLYFWIATCCNTIFNILILASMTVKISKHIIRSIRHSMEKGMRSYLKDPLWKHTLDRWQFNLKCCGVNDFKDWYEISWLDKYHINTQHPLVQSFLLSKDHLHLPVVPWSCCNPEFPMQCFHDPLQQIEFSHLWKEQPDFLDGTIFNNGCLEILRKPIEYSLVGFILAAVFLIINQIVLVIISRLLYTSCRNAVILRDSSGDSPGWIFGRDFLSAVKDRTVSDVMFDLTNKGLRTRSSADEEFIRSVNYMKSKKKKKTVSGDLSSRDSERDPVSSGEEDALMLG